MEQKKIDELKKLIAFGLCIRNSLKSEHDFTMYLMSNNRDDVFELLANCACVFDDDYKLYDMSHEFKEPQTTEFLEAKYAEYMKYKRLKQGETL